MLSEVSEKRAEGPNLVHFDAAVFGKKRLCRLCEKFGENLANLMFIGPCIIVIVEE